MPPDSRAEPVSVVLAEVYHLVRQSLRALLDAVPEFVVVGEASDGLQAVEVVERLQPDVLVTELMLPSLSGLEIIRRVAHRVPPTRTIVLTRHEQEEYVLEALRVGASGYVLKRSDAAELFAAVHAVAAGGRYITPTLSGLVVEAFLRGVAAETAIDAYATLTTREREVFQLMAEGQSKAAIARRLFISVRTVETHRANVLRKLNLHSQPEVFRYAVRRGLLAAE